MRVVVEAEQCEGHALCVDVAPEVFRIGEDGIAQVILESPDGTLAGLAKDAARLCPASAIYVVA